MKNIFNKGFYFAYLTFCIISYGCSFPTIPEIKKDYRKKLEHIQGLITKITPDQAGQLYELVIGYKRMASVISASLETRWEELGKQVQEIMDPADNSNLTNDSHQRVREYNLPL